LTYRLDKFNFITIANQAPELPENTNINLCQKNDIEVYQKDLSLIDVYSADESFVTGTFGGVKPVASVDGRQIGDGKPGSMTARLGKLYNDLVDRECR
jgi:branched-chain amino acid aminotransferase